MVQLFYKFIYNDSINRLLRGLLKPFKSLLPKELRIPPSGVVKFKIKPEKKIIKLKTNPTNYLTHLVFWDGYSSFEYTNIFIKLIKNINVFFDIGANIGYYSIIAGVINQNIEVVGFEPARGPYFYFRENVKLNGCENIVIEKIALNNINGEVEFQEERSLKYNKFKNALSGMGRIVGSEIEKPFELSTVQCMTIDKYVEKVFKNRHVGLIKIDTEGTEHIIFSEGHQVLSKMRPIVICETLYDTIEGSLEEIFKSHGYLFFNHVGEGLVEVSSIKRVEDNGVRNCFFVPSEKRFLVEEFIYV